MGAHNDGERRDDCERDEFDDLGPAALALATKSNCQTPQMTIWYHVIPAHMPFSSSEGPAGHLLVSRYLRPLCRPGTLNLSTPALSRLMLLHRSHSSSTVG